jgi:STE24 endopeptidase
MSITVFAATYYDIHKEKGGFDASIDYACRTALLSFATFSLLYCFIEYISEHLFANYILMGVFVLVLISMIILTFFWPLFFIFLFGDRSARIKLEPHIKKLAEIVDIKGIHFFTLKLWVYNALSGGVIPPYTIMVTTSLLDMLDDEEILSILLHEVGHIKERHLRITMIPPLCLLAINIFIFCVLGLFQNLIMIQTLFLVMIALLYFIPFFYIRRRLEVRADRFAVKLNGKEPLISALTKIEEKNPTKIKERSVNSLYTDHPLYKRRIELIEMMERE